MVVPQGCAILSAGEMLRMLVPPHRDAHRTGFERGLHFSAMEAPGELGVDPQALCERLE
jgi:hypothetical protein